MSFTKIIDDINNVAPAELTGVATGDLPPNTESRAVHVSTGSDGTTLFDLVAAADEGGGVTASATAPDSPSENDLWYDTDGSGNEGPSQLYIYTTVEGSNMDWVAVTPTAALPNLPPMSAAGSYSLVVDDSSNLSWALAESGDSGGDAGGSGPTYTTQADYNETTAGDMVIPSAGRWQFLIESGSSAYASSGRTFTPACTSGFTNITGGFYEWTTVIFAGPSSSSLGLTPLRKAHARWNSIDSQFNIVSVPATRVGFLGNGSGLLDWAAEYSGSGALANNECMFGTSIFNAQSSSTILTDATIQAASSPITQNTYTYGMSQSGGVMTGELVTSGPVTITFYGNSSGTVLQTAYRPRVTLIQIS